MVCVSMSSTCSICQYAQHTGKKALLIEDVINCIDMLSWVRMFSEWVPQDGQIIGAGEDGSHLLSTSRHISAWNLLDYESTYKTQVCPTICIASFNK